MDFEVGKLTKKNLFTNIGAVLVFAYTVYPELNYDMVLDSIKDGTFISACINLGFMYYLFKDGKSNGQLF